MLMTGAGGGAGGAAGAATPPPPPPPMPPIIIIMSIICIGSLWLLFEASCWIELVIWVSIAVSWSLAVELRAVTREAPPPTLLSSLRSIEGNGSRCVGFDMGLSLFRPVVRVLGGEGLGLETSMRCARWAALRFRGSGAGAASGEVSDRVLGLTIAVGARPPRRNSRKPALPGRLSRG